MSGLLFVALAVVWAVVLIPKALRHHDELAKTRSVDKVSDAMRVLARREPLRRGEARLVIDPVPQVPAPQIPAPRPPMDEVSRPRPSAKAAKLAARRRRRILALLLIADLGVGVAAALGRLPVWAPAIPIALTIAFLVVARVTVRRERARRARTLPPMQPVHAALTSVAMELPAPVAPERNEQGLAVVSGLEDTSSLPLDLMEAELVDEDLWDPLPMTLPTYVGKSRAKRSVRTIDLSAPGVSSSGHDATASALVAEAAVAALDGDDNARPAVGS
jgi:membrane protein YdbS with pleckstrin-like domain